MQPPSPRPSPTQKKKYSIRMQRIEKHVKGAPLFTHMILLHTLIKLSTYYNLHFIHHAQGRCLPDWTF